MTGRVDKPNDLALIQRLRTIFLGKPYPEGPGQQ